MKLLVIGNNSNCHIRFNSPFVSGYHAELLLLDNGEILLTDKGSRNGTYLNDQRLQPNKDIPVKRGDAIRFADQLLDWQNVPSLPMPDFTKIKETYKQSIPKQVALVIASMAKDENLYQQIDLMLEGNSNE